MGRSLESKRQKRKKQKAKRKMKQKHCQKDTEETAEETVSHESERDDVPTHDNYCVKNYPELGVDYTAELMKFEDSLQEPGEYTHKYLVDCRIKLRLSLERCHKQLEDALSANSKQAFRHRQQIESIRSFYQTIAYGNCRGAQIVRAAMSRSPSAAEFLK